MLATRASDNSTALVYVNQVGGQDELVFDGASLVFDADGELVARAAQFVEDLVIVDLDVRPVFRKRLLDPRGRAATAAARLTITSASASAPPIRVPPWPPRSTRWPRYTRRSCSAPATTS